MKNLSKRSQWCFLAVFALIDFFAIQFARYSRADRILFELHDVLLIAGVGIFFYSVKSRLNVQFWKPMFAGHFFALLALYLLTISSHADSAVRCLLILAAVVTGICTVLKVKLRRALTQ